MKLLGGYRPGRETTTNMVTVGYEIYETFQRKEKAIMVTLDLDDAYNPVQHITLLTIMLDMGIEM